MSRFPVIVLEGPDGVGKTTLANKLCEVLGARYMHLTYRFKDRMHHYHSAALINALMLAEHQPVVVDRWWPSEIVYADAYRGGTKWPLLGRHLDRCALTHGVSYVFCIPCDRERYLRHYNELKGRRAELFDEGLDRVYDGFVRQLGDMSAGGRPGVYIYDMFEQGHALDSVVQGVVESSADFRATLPSVVKELNLLNLSGNVASAKHVLVSASLVMERSRFKPWCRYDKVDDVRRNQGVRFRLTQALEEARVPECDLAFVNLNRHQVDMTYALLHEMSRHMKVVALGVGAQIALQEEGLAISGVIHSPALWRYSNRPDVEHLKPIL